MAIYMLSRHQEMERGRILSIHIYERKQPLTYFYLRNAETLIFRFFGFLQKLDFDFAHSRPIERKRLNDGRFYTVDNVVGIK